MSKSGKLEDLLQGECIFQEIDEDCKSKLTDYPECVHKYLLNPQLCIDEYLTKKKGEYISETEFYIWMT